MTHLSGKNNIVMKKQVIFLGYIPTLHLTPLKQGNKAGNKANKSTKVFICAISVCPANKLQCDNGFCLPYEKRCDGIQDCYYGRDEQDCQCEYQLGKLIMIVILVIVLKTS